MAENTKYEASIALSKLKHVIMKKKNKKGKEIRGLFIPIEQNYLVEGKEGAVYLNAQIIVRSEKDQYGQDGFISQKGNKKWSECSDEEKEIFNALPILGNVKNWASSGTSDATGAASNEEFDEDDDLPF